MRWVLLSLCVVACSPPKVIKAERWDSAPPPPKPPPVVVANTVEPAPTMTMRRAPSPSDVARQIEGDALPAKSSPYPVHRLRTCPTDLSLAVARTIDGRRPADTIKARYARQHQQPLRREELLDPAVAIAKINTLEATQPVVVPAGFRDDIVTYGRDPAFRLHMARCELADLHTVRRAGYDAALAFLLGASADDVLPILKKSIYPDGTAVQTCTTAADCENGMTCDPVERSCRSTKAKLASFLSRPELDIEDLLVRAMATKLTPQAIERPEANDPAGTWVYGRYTKCDGALCKVTRSGPDGKTSLIHWDNRYAGHSIPGVRDAWQTCRAETRSVTRDGCIAKCPTEAGSKRRAACIAVCTTLCPVEAPNEGPDD